MRSDVLLLVGAIASIGGFTLICCLAVGFLRLASRLLETGAARADALGRLAAAAERLVLVLERTGASPASASAPATTPPPRTAPGAREEAATLRARLEAARAANDPGRVLEIRATLATVLEPEQSALLDRSLARWFMDLIQKRLRQGAISAEVVELATRVAAALDSTPEGASLRAALPTLRRSVGLCARCGSPYTGLADACPACMGAGLPAVSIGPSSPSQDGGSPSPGGTEPAPEGDSQGSGDAPA
jgi:hypothetical protein